MGNVDVKSLPEDEQKILAAVSLGMKMQKKE